MAYEYDVFISYRRQRLKTEWLVDTFLPLFEDNLSNEIPVVLNRPMGKIFFDQKDVNLDLRQFDSVSGIEPGADWQTSLREAIKRSACMLGVWSPPYFYSSWCNVEWKSFQKRQQLTSRRAIVPISIHDGANFPQAARDHQWIDLSDYTFVGEGFSKTTPYVDLQRQVRALARAVAQAIEGAPDFQDWPIEDAVATKAPVIGLTSFANGNG